MDHKTKILKVLTIGLICGIAGSLSNRIWRM